MILSFSLARRGSKNITKTAVCHKPNRERRRKLRLFSDFFNVPCAERRIRNTLSLHRDKLHEKAYCHTKRYA
ncbi:hypothetical protein AM352_12090 [Citrobacter koseri]|nr:hypothetical protein AM352_12090 [Citrobacter koseri]PWY11665.1 hypothetical protein DL345_19595 [Citrobacter koseri]